MALGTPIARGNDGRGTGFTTTLQSGSFTPAADSLLIVCAVINAGGSVTPTVTNHDAGTAWAQVESTVVVGTNRSMSTWACHTGSSPSAANVDVDWGTNNAMGFTVIEITGADVSGTVANSFNDTDTDFDYGPDDAVLALTTPSDLTVGCWYRRAFVTITPEGTVIEEVLWEYGDGNIKMDYDESGDASPSCAVASNVNWGAIAFDIKAAGAGGATNPKGPFTHPLYGPLRGPIS